jgi:hypothetical protein
MEGRRLDVSQNLFGNAQENHEKLQLSYPVSMYKTSRT